MLKLSSILTKSLYLKYNKIPVFSKKLIQNFKTLKFNFATAQTRQQFNQWLLSGNYYKILGYDSNTNIQSLSDQDIKKQYLGMVKKYHSDSVIDPTEKLENQEITKCIIMAYDKLSSIRVQNKINAGVYDKIYKDQDQIAMKIYGKKFNEIKYDLFKEGNAQKRSQFMTELDKIRKESSNYQPKQSGSPYASQNTGYQNFTKYASSGSSSKSSSSQSYLSMGVAGSVVLAFIIYEFNKQSQKQTLRTQRNNQKHTLTQQKIKQIQKKSIQQHDKKLSDLIDSFTQEMPPSLKYSNVKDPHQLEQLIEYTIGNDIHLWEVPAALMNKKDNLQKLNSLKNPAQIYNLGIEFQPFPLTKIKVNTFITLSLQAQRCLQNIYIKVKDVADQIEQTGKYIPPTVLFRFYGYVMFNIRSKPLSLQNYRNTQYISLFDLFFDYYSPIPIKRHEFNEYLVGFNDQDQKMYGQVHLNHRKIPQRFINKEDKLVVMRDQISDIQNKYSEIWDNFYNKYQRIWKRENPGRISTTHL